MIKLKLIKLEKTKMRIRQELSELININEASSHYVSSQCSSGQISPVFRTP